MDQWRSLKSELSKEAEQIFASSGEIVLVEFQSAKGGDLACTHPFTSLIRRAAYRRL